MQFKLNKKIFVDTRKKKVKKSKSNNINNLNK